jgi:hypothetical protein
VQKKDEKTKNSFKKGFVLTLYRFIINKKQPETDRFFAASGVQLAQSNSGPFHYHRVVFSLHLKSKIGNILDLKSKIGNILVKGESLRMTLHTDETPLTSRSHTHPSHSQTSRLLTSSLSVGVPVPHATQCMSGV